MNHNSQPPTEPTGQQQPNERNSFKKALLAFGMIFLMLFQALNMNSLLHDDDAQPWMKLIASIIIPALLTIAIGFVILEIKRKP